MHCSNLYLGGIPIGIVDASIVTLVQPLQIVTWLV